MDFADRLWVVQIDEREFAALVKLAGSVSGMIGGESTGDALARLARQLDRMGLVRYVNSREGGWPPGSWGAYPTCNGFNAMWRHAGNTHVDGCGAPWNPNGRCSGCSTGRRLDLAAYEEYLAAIPDVERTKQLSTAALWCDEHGYLRDADTTTHKMCRFTGSPIHSGMVNRISQLYVPSTNGPQVDDTIYRLRPSWHPRIEPDVFVPAALALLSGKTAGIVDPPVNLYWQPGTIDFSSDADLRKFYSSAIRSLTTPDDFATWINADTLTRLWRHIALPSVVRKAWETIHPQLRGTTPMNARLHIQDVILEAIGQFGFALAGGSALLDYDIVTRDTDDIDAFLNSTSVATFTAAAEAVVAVCDRHGWAAHIQLNQDWNKIISVTVPGVGSTAVQLVHHQRSTDPEHRDGGGLRLVFSDVVAGKAVALADSARGRDFDDIAHVINSPGWTLAQVEQSMSNLGYQDKIPGFRTNIERFRRQEFDQNIRDEGFDPDFAHRMLDQE